MAIGRAGLGAIPQPLYDRAQGKERQDLVLEEVRAGVEDVRINRMMSLQQQGTSTRWEGALERKLTWNDICKAEPQSIKLMIQAVYDMLPSPANLHVWGKKRPCLCPRRGTLEHILSSYPTTLGGGCYRWRHDQVLKVVAETISSAVSNNKHARSWKLIPFVNAGKKPRSQPTPSISLLSSASDWELRVGLGRQLKFPEHVTSAYLRPGVVLTSTSSKQVLLLELEVPWEDHMEEANKRKRFNYQELIEECQRTWKAHCEPVELGCWGFTAHPLCRVHSLLGISGAAKRRAIKSATEAAERASQWNLDQKVREVGQRCSDTSRGLITLAESPDGGCLMLRDPKHPRISGNIIDYVSQHIT